MPGEILKELEGYGFEHQRVDSHIQEAQINQKQIPAEDQDVSDELFRLFIFLWHHKHLSSSPSSTWLDRGLRNSATYPLIHTHPISV